MLNTLRRFVMTSWGGNQTADAEAKELFDKSGLGDGNTFVLFLDSDGKLVHGFRAYATGGRQATYVQDEIAKGLAKLALPDVEPKPAEKHDDLKLPDVASGVRLYIKAGSSIVVEAVAMGDDARKSLRRPDQPSELDASVLKDWLSQLYPPAIRASEQQKPFTKITGTLALRPASDGRAVLAGDVRAANEDGGSAFVGRLEAVLTYRDAGLRTIRGVVEGSFDYRVRGRKADDRKMAAAIESRPE